MRPTIFWEAGAIAVIVAVAPACMPTHLAGGSDPLVIQAREVSLGTLAVEKRQAGLMAEADVDVRAEVDAKLAEFHKTVITRMDSDVWNNRLQTAGAILVNLVLAAALAWRLGYKRNRRERLSDQVLTGALAGSARGPPDMVR